MSKLLEKTINYSFKNSVLLQTALTHPSYLNEHSQEQDSYQRLEFLGDAVLEFLASDYLFKHFSKIREGRLTEIRSALVRTESLAKIANKISLGSYLLLSKGEENNLGRKNENILADAIEALIASIYLDASLEQAKQFFLKFIKVELDEIIKQKLYLDPKTQLQELLQARYKQTPVYKMIDNLNKGPENQFCLGVYLKDKCLAKGYGKNKRLAEQMAARTALGKLNKL